jgi:hypothetical protein
MRYIAEDSPPRRAARTLEQAFGPHTSHHIDEPPEPPTAIERVLGTVYWLAAAALLVAMFSAPAWWPKALHP